MEKVRYEFVRFDPFQLGKREPREQRAYRVTQFTHYPNGSFQVDVPQPHVIFTYEERINIQKLQKRKERLFRESLRDVPGPFSEAEKNKLRSLRRAVQQGGLTEFLVDFVPRYSIESVLRELNS